MTPEAKAKQEAQRRLKEFMPHWVKTGWTLCPVILKEYPKGEKLCKPYYDKTKPQTPEGKYPRLIIKKPEDMPIGTNAILALSSTWSVIDIDTKVKLPTNFPTPAMIVQTGKGEHWYYKNGDIHRSYNLSFGECQSTTRGVFMPGSYHPVKKTYYKIIKINKKHDKLYIKHIKPFIKNKEPFDTKNLTQGNINPQIIPAVRSVFKTNDPQQQKEKALQIINQILKHPNKESKIKHTTDFLQNVEKQHRNTQNTITNNKENWKTPPKEGHPAHIETKYHKLQEEINKHKTKENKKNTAKLNIEPIENTATATKEWLIPNWIPKTGVITITADKATGKTSTLFALCKHLTSPANKDMPLSPTQSTNKIAFLYAERPKSHYRNLWDALNGKPNILTLWRWNSEYKTNKENTANWTLENIRRATKENPHQIWILDRGDLIVTKNDKFVIRNSILELDEIAEETNSLFILVRHTSKPQGTDARAFTERTDGFKEWQHTPSVCLFLHPYDNKLLLFKQYANECSQNGLITFGWKDNNGIYIPEFESIDNYTTKQDIEDTYNPKDKNKEKPTEALNKQNKIREIFMQNYYKTNFNGQDVYRVPKAHLDQKIMGFMSYNQAKRIIKEHFKGQFSGTIQSGNIDWMIPAKNLSWLDTASHASYDKIEDNTPHYDGTGPEGKAPF